MKSKIFKAARRASLGLAVLLLANCGSNNNNQNPNNGYGGYGGGYGVAPIACPGGQTLAQNVMSTIQTQYGSNSLTVNIFDQSTTLSYLDQQKSVTMQGTLTWNDLQSQYMYGQMASPIVQMCSPSGGQYNQGSIQITLQGYAQVQQVVYPQQQQYNPYNPYGGYGPQMPQTITRQLLVNAMIYGGVQMNNRLGGQIQLTIEGRPISGQMY